MKITGIKEKTASRSEIYLDDRFAFVLYKGELRFYRIKEGEELSEEVYHEILTTVLPKRAKLRALNLLKSRDYTKYQLSHKLAEGGYPMAVIEEALAYVMSFGYVDDLRFAQSYIRCTNESRSRSRIEQDLLRKGIDKETVKKAWELWEEEGNEKDEMALILALLNKKHYNPETADYKEKQRIFGYLLRKGFPQDLVRKALDINCHTV